MTTYYKGKPISAVLGLQNIRGQVVEQTPELLTVIQEDTLVHVPLYFDHGWDITITSPLTTTVGAIVRAKDTNEYFVRADQTELSWGRLEVSPNDAFEWFSDAELEERGELEVVFEGCPVR